MEPATKQASQLAEFMRNRNQSILNHMFAKDRRTTPALRSCGRIEYNEHTGYNEFVIYDESGNIESRSTIYPGESLNGWTI